MSFQYYLIIVFLFIAGVLFFLLREIKKSRKQLIQTDHKSFLLLQVIILIGVLARILNLSYPDGIFVDGAMGAYDSWCMATFGVDSNLTSWPVYLKSWGTGQSALYAYLALPFIKIFGLSTEVYRLPGALVGCIALLIFYWSLRKSLHNTLLVLCLVGFLALNPWHIMKCRLAVDCNLFPDLLLIGISFIILACYQNNKRSLHYILGFVFMSISAYGYGVSWFMLPILYIVLFVYLLRKNIIDTKTIIACAGISLMIVFPLILFTINLLTKGDAYQLGPITITALTQGRHESTTIIGSSNLLPIIRESAGRIFKLIVYGQETDMPDTSIIYPFGIFYNLWSLPFLAIGIYYSIKKKQLITNILWLWIASSILILLLVTPNMPHWNVLWIPLSLFVGYGLYRVVRDGGALVKKSLLAIYLISFICFFYTYRQTYEPALFYSNKLCKAEVLFTRSLNVEKVYYPLYFNYAYVLYYTQMSPYEYNKNKAVVDDPSVNNVKSFSNIEFGYPSEAIESTAKTAYLVRNENLKDIDLSRFKIKKGDYFSVVWND